MIKKDGSVRVRKGRPSPGERIEMSRAERSHRAERSQFDRAERSQFDRPERANSIAPNEADGKRGDLRRVCAARRLRSAKAACSTRPTPRRRTKPIRARRTKRMVSGAIAVGPASHAVCGPEETACGTRPTSPRRTKPIPPRRTKPIRPQPPDDAERTGRAERTRAPNEPHDLLSLDAARNLWCRGHEIGMI
jgi:hypothetical protein